MAKIDPIEGKWIILRCAEEKDAEFTLNIRNDEVLTKYIPKVDSTLENQRLWIKKTLDKENECFFVYENKKGELKGTISYYDVDYENNVCELGRYISYGNAIENVEAAILLLDYLFNNLHMEKIILTPDERNKNIISFWKKFGAEFDESINMGNWSIAQYVLTIYNYNQRYKKIKSLI